MPKLHPLALVQLPRPIPPAPEEPASPDSWEQEELTRGREGRGACWGQQGGAWEAGEEKMN